jgi:hypothetical protein
MDPVLENLLLAYIKGSYMIKKLKKIEKNFVPRSLKTNGPIKIFTPKSYYLCITNDEIVQYSKSKAKKFSFLCTFKRFTHTGSGWPVRPTLFLLGS